MNAALTLDDLDRLTGGKLGTHDVPCPLCGPFKRRPVSQRRRVLRIWLIEPTFGTFCCARCGEKGHARDRSAPPPDPKKLEQARAEAAERDRNSAAEQLRTARWLWSCRQPLAGSVAERYLRDTRGYSGPLPGSLGFLPARDDYQPALIAAFGLAHEPEPGVIVISDDAVRGVHITRLSPNATKAGTATDKIIKGRSVGFPIVLAPPNDLLGLVIAEGIEDALSAHEALGIGAWAAGSASRMPQLADRLDDVTTDQGDATGYITDHRRHRHVHRSSRYITALTIMVDDDTDGRRHAAKLATAAKGRGIETRAVLLSRARLAA